MTIKTIAALSCVAALFAVTADDASAKSSRARAEAACGSAAIQEAYYMFPQARQVQREGATASRWLSDNEVSVSGEGRFDSRSGWSRFRYSCIYNVASNSTYAVNVRGGGAVGRRHDGSDAEKVAGAVIGTAIAAAIIASQNHKHEHHAGGGRNDWFSPASGVRCSSSQSICYDNNGTVARKWTRRVFIDGDYAN